MKNPTIATLLTLLLALPGAAPAAVYVFTGSALLITDVSTANPYPGAILVSGIPAGERVVDVNITISSITHSFIDDTAGLVGSPAGQFVVLFDGAGSRTQVLNQTWVFDDAAGLPLPTGVEPATGTWQPSDQYGSIFPIPVPAGPHPNTLATFNDTDPNGWWTFYVADFVAGDSGSIGGWELRLTTVPIPEPGVPLFAATLAAVTGLRRRRHRP